MTASAIGEPLAGRGGGTIGISNGLAGGGFGRVRMWIALSVGGGRKDLAAHDRDSLGDAA